MDLNPAVISILIVAVAMVSFVLEKIPLAMTAICAALAMAITGCIKLSDAYSVFGSSTTVFCAGMMVVGNALFNTGFSDFVARGFEKMGLYSKERLFLVIIAGVSAVLSMFLSNSAVVALFIPLIGIVAAKSNGQIKARYAIMTAGLGACIGGFSALTGSSIQLVAQGIMQNTPGVEPMGIFTLTRMGGPMILLFMLYTATIGYSICQKVLDFEDPKALFGQGDDAEYASSAQHIAPWKLPFSIIMMCLIVAAFVLELWDIATVSLVGASIMVLSGCISFKDAIRRMDWNTLIILSAAQAFAKGLTAAGGGKLIADTVIRTFGTASSSMLILSVLIIACVILTNFASNTALVAMFVPIAIAVAKSLGVNPTSWAVIITIACNIACATPVGTPCMTQTLVGGYRYMDYVKCGGILTVVLTIACILLAPICYPF